MSIHRDPGTMDGFAEYEQYDGLGLAELIRTRKVSAREVTEAAIARIERRNPSLNAVVNKMYDRARASIASAAPQGPFGGVPFLLKDLLAMYEGVPTSAGNRLLRDIPARQDSEIVRRYRNAGLVILGKTNTPEFGLVPYTESEALGVARNPWDHERTPGGSSGGSAAAVASRMVPIAGGGDGGGSIRIPASCCGVFGFKPSRGSTPTGPTFGEFWRGFVVEHVLARSVRDSAAMLDAIGGSDPGAPYAAPRRERPLLQEVGADVGRLRIAYSAKPLLGNHVHDDCRRALDDAVKLLVELGHDVTEAAPEFDGDAFAVAFVTVVAAEARADIEMTAALAGRKPRMADFEAATWGLGLVGKATSASAYASAVRSMQMTARTVGRFLERYDVVLTPTLADPPPVIGELQPSRGEIALMKTISRLHAGWLLGALDVVKPLAEKTLAFIPYTPVFNVTGQPAMSVPLYWNDAGLPIGVHFAARLGADDLLFRLAAQLERARPWFDRAPPG
ncbi:MAG TPA: amidase [Gemmatimonadaceae bacterium]|nr:amidase [Gemmatimonadaceae bacterium]